MPVPRRKPLGRLCSTDCAHPGAEVLRPGGPNAGYGILRRGTSALVGGVASPRPVPHLRPPSSGPRGRRSCSRSPTHVLAGLAAPGAEVGLGGGGRTPLCRRPV